MSVFSTLLSRHISSKNIKVANMATYCNIDRSNFYKIIHGDRNPPSREVVAKMGQFMCLMPSEMNEFLEAYKIDMIGEDNYYRRKNVMDLIDAFNQRAYFAPSSTYNSVTSPVFTQQMENPASLISLDSSLEVTLAVTNLFYQEAEQPQGHIRLLLQPGEDSFFQILKQAGEDKENLTVEHILCLNSTASMPYSRQDYNLYCLQTILPLYLAGFHYDIYYYYDNYISRASTLRLFPYLILTSSHALLISGNRQKGIVFHDKEMIHFFENVWNDYRKHVNPLFFQIRDAYSQLNYWKNVMARNRDRSYCLMITPCFTPYITADMLRKHLTVRTSNQETFISDYLVYTKSINTPVTSYFSEESVLYFLKTGLIDEFPHDLYTAVSMEERIYLLECLLSDVTLRPFRLLRKSLGHIPGGLFIYVDSATAYLQFQIAQNKVMYLQIEESNLFNTFHDFLENMDDSLFYSEEESISRIRKLMEEFQTA
ncbi:MAG: hypothetical protein LUF92_09830 [Clostridiales bacterium]|nr:hypothetical protein [Clostridiales bacterium]